MSRQLRAVSNSSLTALFCVWTTCIAAISASAADWPQWRHDAGRTAASPEELAAELHLQWVRHLPPPRPAWPKYPRACFDTSYEPVVLGKTMFVPSMVTDSLTALDTDTGAEKWRFYTDGPVRFAPVAFQGKVCLVSDDGYLYCLDAADGRLLWEFRGLPAEREDRKVLGNDRLISLWPARGGPVLADGKIYFAAGVWPFEGVYIYAVDAESGKSVWSNKDTGYIEQGLTDHSTRQEAGLSPQGYLALVGGGLYVPSGRALPGVLDPNTGKLRPYLTGWGGRENLEKGCWYVAGNGKYLFQSGDPYDLATRTRLQIDPANAKELGTFREPVLTEDAVYFSRPVNQPRGYRPAGVGYDGLVAWDVTQPPELKYIEDQQKKKWPAAIFHELWALPSDLKVHIKSGPRLYGGSEGAVAAVDLPGPGGLPEVSWKTQIEGTPANMLSADGKLFVVTDRGSIYAFGPQKVEPRTFAAAGRQPPPQSDQWTQAAGEILKTTGAQEGYCLVLGVGTGRLVAELARQSKLHVIAVDPDHAKVQHLRRELDEAGLYGTRVALLADDPLACPLPSYVASLIVCEDPAVAQRASEKRAVAQVFRLLRPYGGVACLRVPADRQGAFADAVEAAASGSGRVKRAGDFALLERPGALPGSADWTHEDADSGNSLVSRDQRVQGPFGILWFGGAVDMLYPEWDFTHSNPPTLLVAGGRMFFQVFPNLHAVDIYTGRHLWTRTMPGTENNPQRRNVPYAATADSVYVVSGRTCARLDVASGSTLAELKAPVDAGAGGWREIRIWQDALIGAVGNTLVCINRRSGETAWTHTARRELVGLAVGGGKVFSADASLPDRKGAVTTPEATLLALDVGSGQPIWQAALKVAGEKRLPLRLAYSADHDMLVAVYGTVSAYGAKDGSLLWGDQTIEGGDQPMLHRDRLISQVGRAYDPRTGSPLPQRLWDIQKRGCTRVVAAEHLVTIRHGHASYLDFVSGRQTFFRGVRAGCTNSLIPADGLLNAPNFSHGCACNYPVFASTALVPIASADQ